MLRIASQQYCLPSSSCQPPVDNLTRSKAQSAVILAESRGMLRRTKERYVLHGGLCDLQQHSRTVPLSVWAHGLARRSLPLRRGRSSNYSSSVASSSEASRHGGATGTTVSVDGSGGSQTATPHSARRNTTISGTDAEPSRKYGPAISICPWR